VRLALKVVMQIDGDFVDVILLYLSSGGWKMYPMETAGQRCQFTPRTARKFLSDDSNGHKNIFRQYSENRL